MGTLFTITVTLSLSLEVPLLTVTVYVVVEFGLTVILCVVAPVFHRYVPPPLAVNVTLSPLHIN